MNIRKRTYNLGLKQYPVLKKQTAVKKTSDPKGNPSVHDIESALNEIIRPRTGDRWDRWVLELYPTNYPSGTVVIEEGTGGERHLMLYSYSYTDGNVAITNEGTELEREYTEKKSMEGASGDAQKFDFDIEKMEAFQFIAPDDFEIGGVQIQKGEELHYTLGVVLEPETIDATTTQQSKGDIYSDEEVRKAAYHFMANYDGTGNDFMHDGKNNQSLKVVESYIAPQDMTIGNQPVKKGSWLMATLILDKEVWKLVKAGQITGYSIGGVANAKLETA